MIVPFVSPYLPQMLPLYPGLSHSGPIAGFSTQGGIPYGPYGIRGGIPYGYGYGYGLAHAGWDPQGIGAGVPYGTPGIGYGNGGYGPIGHGIPSGLGYGMMGQGPQMHGGMPGIPLQPAWSMGPVAQPMPGTPNV